jgi:hypothetical protein
VPGEIAADYESRMNFISGSVGQHQDGQNDPPHASIEGLNFR